MISVFSLSCILVVVFTLFVGVVIYLKGQERVVSISYALVCLGAAIFGIGSLILGVTTSKEVAYRGWQIAHIGMILTPPLFLHFVCKFTKVTKKPLIFFSYMLGFIYIGFAFLYKEFFIGELELVFNQFYWMAWSKKKSLLYLSYYIVFYHFLISYAFFLLVKFYKKSSGLARNRAKYIILASLIGWVGPHGMFLLVFGINVYPLSNFLIAIYPLIIGYAIFRYRLMDVTVAITRTGIFISVYSLILGTPFVVAYRLRPYLTLLLGDNWWIGPLALSTFLATSGPFIYLYIQRRAEDALLREQRRYQKTLRQASSGMTRIRDLKKLLNLIVHIVTRTVRIKYSSIYLLEPNNHIFTLQAHRDKKKSPPPVSVEENTALIKALRKKRVPLVYEEIKQEASDFNDSRLLAIQKQMESLGAAVVVPSLVEDELIGFLTLGEKISGHIYSPDDLSVFSVLTNQAALAIENAQFYEDIKETQTQLFQAEKMTTIGTMADGLSHQINNRFHALGMIAADTLDTIKLLNDNSSPEEMREAITQISHALERVKENVKQGGEVVHGLLKYSRAGESGFKAIDLNELVDASLEMAQYKVKLSQIDLIRDYSQDIPKIKGNFVQLQEVFFNLIDNAYDAIMQRRSELKEEGYRGNVTIQAEATDSSIEIRFIDNGMGVKDAEQVRLFTPFFTTKASSKKGTGLGLYVIQKIIVNNHKGRIGVTSEYGSGTMFTMKLPAQK